MQQKDSSYIVIPTYNEAPIITSVISELHQAGHHNIIVVDDGSEDKTYSEAVAAGAIVVRHSLNRGKGAAVKTGIEAAKLMGATSVVTFDGDGQHDPSDVIQALSLLKTHDVVLGMRDFSQKHIPPHKKIGNFLANIITWFVYGLWVRDSQSGMRAYSKKAIDTIETQSDRYEYDSEIMREIVRNKLTFTHMRISVRYTKYSQSKANRQSLTSALKTAVRMVLSN